LSCLVLLPIAACDLGTADSADPAPVKQAPPSAESLAVSALGRIEPEDGILRVGIGSTPEAVNGSIVRTLMVKAGDDVRQGQVLAETDTIEIERAEVAVAAAQLALAEREAEMAVGEEQDACSRADVAQRTSKRHENLLRSGATSAEEADIAAGDARARSGSCSAARIATKARQAAVEVARARVQHSQATLERCTVRAPADGRILRILAYPGEIVALEGLLEMAKVGRMYAIAEVWETDIRRTRIGQKATVTSPALDGALSGVVEHVRLQVRKQDTTGTDPVSRKDARIVEVEVLLDEPAKVASLTNLQVEVVLHP
jgi:HlyD family secretion protein